MPVTSAPVSPVPAAIAVKFLKEAVKDYNYWGESESDSPLVIKRTKTRPDDKKLLSLDASMRSKASGIEGYKAPERTVRMANLEEVFKTLTAHSLRDLETRAKEVQDGMYGLESLQTMAQAVEYYVQLYSVFCMLAEAMVCYVEDTSATDPYTGLFILGITPENETVYAQALLTQT